MTYSICVYDVIGAPELETPAPEVTERSRPVMTFMPAVARSQMASRVMRANAPNRSQVGVSFETPMRVGVF